MNNAAQIDLHTASVMLKNKIIESHYFNMWDCRNFIKIQISTMTCRRTSVAAARMLALCPVTVGRFY